MDLTIGISTWNQKALLEQLLDSIYGSIKEVTFEIVVVANGSKDGTVEMVRERYPDVALTVFEENIGIGGARKHILSQGTGRYILSLDVDTTLYPNGAVETLVATMDNHPNAAIAGPKLVYKDGSLQLSCRPFPSPLNILIEGTFLRKYFSNSRFVKDYTMEDWDHSQLREVDWMYGAALIIRRSLLDAVVYDPNFRHKYEDVDHCFQARKAGYKVLYVPEAVICHHLEVENNFSFSKSLLDHMHSMARYLTKDYLKMIAMKAIRKWPENKESY